MSSDSTPLARPDQDGIRYRPIAGFPGYCVGDDGSVWSRWGCRNRICFGRPGPWFRLKDARTRHGYLAVHLYRNGHAREYKNHALVLEAFVGPRPPGQQACHWDGNPANARLNNLRWGTPLENSADARRHGTTGTGEKNQRAKVTEEDVQLIRFLMAVGVRRRRIAAIFGIHLNHVTRINTGTYWSHVS